MFAEVMMQDYVLRTWRRNPAAPRSSYVCLSGWRTGPGSDLPPTVAEIDRRKEWMRRNAPRCYYGIFPEEDPDGGCAG
ncbi:MAG: hypothetical protein JNK40_02225 [Chromatiales bacterium]|nr:hypothetical protein [Chromatiales bacterium]